MDDKLLLPCPFCGGQVKLMAIAGEPYPPTYEVDIANITVESDDICYVHCPTCDANWHIELRIDAFPLKTIAAWNRRADQLPDATKMVSNADRIRSMSDIVLSSTCMSDIAQDLLDTIEALQKENEQLKADLRGKDNEINDLEARIEYLRKFKPKKNGAVREGNV